MISSLALIHLFLILPTTLALRCFDTTSLLPNRDSFIEVGKCEQDPFIQRHSISYIKEELYLTPEFWNIHMNCTIEEETCGKVEQVFQNIGKYFLDLVEFKSPVNVEVIFREFCNPDQEDCDNSSSRTLGIAGPTRYFLIEDDDGLKRLYPQLLAKQLKLDIQPNYSKYDIQAVFNSQVDWYFKTDEISIQPNQTDFALAVSHELIHGFGFLTSWAENFSSDLKALTPTFISPDHEFNLETFEFNGFFEYPLDKFMVVNSSKYPVTQFTRELNEFSHGKTQFANYTDFVDSVVRSPTYMEIATRMYQYATTPEALAIYSKDHPDIEPIILETSLDPLRTGTSIMHFDYKMYSNSSDFMMRYALERGVSFNLTSQEHSHDYPEETSPFGPNIQHLLKLLGYKLKTERLETETASIQLNSSSSLAVPSTFLTWVLLSITACLLV